MVAYQRIPMEKIFTSYYIDNHVNNHLKNMHTALVALNKAILIFFCSTTLAYCITG